MNTTSGASLAARQWIRRVGAVAVTLGAVLLSACGGAEDVAPTISAQPQSLARTEGQTASFTVAASGTAPLTYAWQSSRDGGVTWTMAAGASAATHTTAATVMADDGLLWRAVVSNVAGAVNSSNAQLTVMPAPVPPTIAQQPQGLVLAIGQTATFTVSAGGTAPLVYQWRRDGVALVDGAATADRGGVSGSASPTLTVSAVQAADAGSYTVDVGNSVGTLSSQGASLTTMVPTAFSVTDYEPSAGAYSVPPDAVIQITFSAPVDPASLAGGVFAMTDGDYRPVAGTLVVSGAVATFTPAAPLSPAVEQPYRVSVSRGATSLTGAMLDEDLSFNFTLNDPPGAAWEIRISTYWLNFFGRVRDSLGRIDCGVTSEICSAYFAQGSTVQFTATPLPGFEFLSWGGGSCGAFGAAPVINFVVNGSTVCGANFSPISGQTFTMTITTGYGVGRVIDDTGYNFLTEPRIVDCGTQVPVLRCGGTFGAGRQIAFRAFPEPLAPAGQFHWRCTHPDPENQGGINYVGVRPLVWFTQNLACFVELVPN